MKKRWITPSALVLCAMLAYAGEANHALKLDPQKTYSVRLVLVGQMRLLNIGELQVFSGERNIALEGKARMSSQNERHPAANLIDGNTSGKASETGGMAHTWGEVAPWAEISLPKTGSIEKIVVWNRFPEGEDCTTRLLPFRLSVLDENRKVVWETLIRRARIQTLTEAKAGDNRFQKIEVPVSSETK